MALAWKARFASGIFIMSMAGAMPASADMGRAPVSLGTYGSVEGGYLLHDSDGVVGYGATATPGTVTDVEASPGDGWFAGGMVGFAGQSPLMGGMPFTRIEFYGLYGRSDDGVSQTSPPLLDISLKNVDASLLVTGGLTGSTSVERAIAEGGFRLEGDQIVNPTTSITWVVAPFVRWSGEDTDTVVSCCADLFRTASVDTWMYGVMFAAEPEVWLSSQVALVGRLGAGLYGFSTSGDYASFSNLPGADPFAATLSDSDSGIGFRGQLGVGLKFKLTPTANLETFGEADYFSDIGTARFSNNQPGDGNPSFTGTTDLWELRAGARVTIGFGSAN